MNLSDTEILRILFAVIIPYMFISSYNIAKISDEVRAILKHLKEEK